MNRNTRDGLSIQSPLARSLAKIFLVVMVIAYLAFISYSYYGRLDSSRSVVRLILLWALGAVATALVMRSWRRERK